MTELERRYRWLLKAYPRPYREYRADEILEIVLARADDEQRRPSLRESWALAVGGLRARTGVDRLDAQALRRSMLRLSTLALLIYGLTRWATYPISAPVALLSSEDTYYVQPWTLVVPTMLAIAVLTAAWGHYKLAFGAVILAVLTHHWEANQFVPHWSADSLWYMTDSRFWSLLLPMLTLLSLFRAPRRAVTRPWVWPLFGALTVAALTPNPINNWSDTPTMSLYAFAVLAIIAAPIDARMPIVAFALLLVPALARTTYHLRFFAINTSVTAILILAVLMATTLATGMIASRRQARM